MSALVSDIGDRNIAKEEEEARATACFCPLVVTRDIITVEEGKKQSESYDF